MRSPINVIRNRDQSPVHVNRRRAGGLAATLTVGVLAAGPAHRLTETAADAGVDGGARVARHIGLGLGTDFTPRGDTHTQTVAGHAAGQHPTHHDRMVLVADELKGKH